MLASVALHPTVSSYFKILLYVHGRFACLFVCAPHVCLCPWQPEESMRSPGTGVTGGCEPSFGCFELNPGPLEEQVVLVTPEQSLCSSTLLFETRPVTKSGAR